MPLFASPPRAAFMTLAAAFVLLACSSSGKLASSDDAGDSAVNAQFCDEYGTYLATCPQPDLSATCQKAFAAELQECNGVASLFSTSFKQMVVECGMECEAAYNDPFLSSCYESKVSSIVLSPTQQKLASDYCAICAAPTGVSAATCAEEFWGLGPDASPANGEVGGPALIYADTVIESVAQTCLPPLGAGSEKSCTAEFNACVSAAVTAAAAVAPGCPGSGASGDAGG